MAEPAPTPEAPAPEAAPAAPATPQQSSDPVAAVPDLSADVGVGDFGELSFEQALEDSIKSGEESVVAEPTQGDATPTTETTSPEAAEKTAEAEATTESSETEGEPDYLEALDANVGEDWTPKASAAFQKLKSANKELVSERTSLSQQVKEAQAKIAELEGVVGNETVDALKEKVQQYEQAQMLSNLEATDAYDQAVNAPLDKIFADVEALAEKHEINYEHLVDAMTIENPDEQEERVSELLATASDRERANFYRLAAELDPILERRAEMRENVDAALKEANLAAEEKAKSEAADKAQHRQVVTKNVVQRIQDKVPFLKEFENLDLESVQKEAASADPSVVHPVDFAYQAVAARLMPSIVREYAAAQKTIESLTSQLASYEDAEPKLSGGDASPLSGAASADSDFASAIEQSLSRG